MGNGCRSRPLTPGRGYVRSTYSAREVDFIAVYCRDLDRAFAVPIDDIDGASYLHLRIAPARNNQRTLVRWAAQYELGAIAQLGERVTGSHEVVGSIPIGSTTLAFVRNARFAALPAALHRNDPPTFFYYPAGSLHLRVSEEDS
mgnify:CR=1 FL=1